MWKCNPHAAHERTVEDDGANLVPAGEVHGGDGADTLAVEDDVLRRDSQPRAESVPGRLYVGVQILLWGFSFRHPVATVVVAEDVAVDPGPEAQVEGGHLAQVHGVAVRVEDGEASIGGALDVHAGDPVTARSSGVEHLQALLLPLTVLPLRLLAQHQLLLVVGAVFILEIFPR